MRDKKAINKLIEFSEKIVNFCGGVDKNEFISDIMLHEACVFNLIQMGEQINMLSDGLMEKYSGIQWHEIRGLRNRLVHDYGGININLVWDIINDLPSFIDTIKAINTNF